MVGGCKVYQGQLLCKDSYSELSILQRNELNFWIRHKFWQNQWSVKDRSRAPGQGACSKSVSRTMTIQFHTHSYHCCREMNFICRHDINFLDSTQNFTKSVERVMKVKSIGSRCLLEECVKGNYYARFHPPSYHCCREMNFISRLNANFLDLTQIFKKSVELEMNVKGTVSMCLL